MWTFLWGDFMHKQTLRAAYFHQGGFCAVCDVLDSDENYIQKVGERREKRFAVLTRVSVCRPSGPWRVGCSSVQR